MDMVLEQERATFDRHKEELLAKAKGKFVLIHEDEVLGIFETQREAIHEGYDRLGNVPFLTHKILETQESYFITNSHGLVNFDA